jgi:magnesium chelatase subunit D
VRPSAAQDIDWTAPLLALMGTPLGGVVLAEDAEESWHAAYKALVPQDMELRSVPASVTAEQLTGALDLATTLATGTAVMQAGILRQDEVSSLLVRRAARLEAVSVALLGAALDRAQLVLAATDDGHDDQESLSHILQERLAFDVRHSVSFCCNDNQVRLAREILPHVAISAHWIGSLCSACLTLGITSPRVGVMAVAVAKGHAALAGRLEVQEDDVTLAARLVLAHRALRFPQPNEQQQPEPPPEDAQASDEQKPMQKPADAEVVVAAVKTALPPHVLQSLLQGQGRKAAARSRNEKRKNALAAQRGRVTGTMRASNLARQRLNILATLRTAAPWQLLRRKNTSDRLIVLRDDLRVSRRKQRTEATAIFAVDASGSTAFQRLSEAKGAVETLLSECYVRRDRVAVIAFRSKSAEVLLPPSRSLERARRALAALAGGGGTPMASALDQVSMIADQVKRGGGKPIVILLTDGRANVTRAGEGDKLKAGMEAEDAAKHLASARHEAMVLDVSPEPQKTARTLAQLLDGQYMHLPRAGASALAAPVRAALQLAAR